MKRCKLATVLAAGFSWVALLNAQGAGPTRSPSSVRSEAAASFHWPNGKEAAVSLSFDDARVSQIDVGLPLFEKLGVKVTFFVVPRAVEKRLNGWKRAVADGDEIGNHTVTHPCTGNYPFSRGNALENYDLKMMAAELDGNNEQIRKLLGVTPKDFAYPCGQKFVGAGLDVESYVPLVAERFLLGRSFLSEQPNDPAVVDLAQAMGTGSDDMPFSRMKQVVDTAIKRGSWVIFAGHDIGTRDPEDTAPTGTTDTKALETLIPYLKDPANGIWLGTVEEIGAYVKQNRRAEK